MNPEKVEEPTGLIHFRAHSLNIFYACINTED